VWVARFGGHFAHYSLLQPSRVLQCVCIDFLQ
jgi:hypothetical protein